MPTKVVLSQRIKRFCCCFFCNLKKKKKLQSTFFHRYYFVLFSQNGFVSALPYLSMWLFSMFISHVADWMISSSNFNHTVTRKIINGIGQFGPALALAAASYTGCNRWLTVALLTIGIGLNGAIYSGFKVNHLDISPRFAGILMSFTNCLANLAGLLAPVTAGYIIDGPVMTNNFLKMHFLQIFFQIWYTQ